MKCTCNTKTLRKTIESVLPGIAPKALNDTLECIKFELEDNKLTLSATDTNNYYQSHMETKDTEPGVVLTKASQFYSIIKACDAETIHIEGVGNKNLALTGLKIKTDNAEYTIPVKDAKDFPAPPVTKGAIEYEFELTSEKFREIIRKTAYAASKDEKRPLFTGIYINIDEEATSFVATDTHRLSIYKLTDKHADKKCHVNIPVPIMVNVAKVLEANETIHISFAGRQTKIKTENWEITSNSIEGSFPDYKRIIPASGTTTMNINRKKLANAVERVSLCCSSENDYKVVVFEINNDKLTIRSHGASAGNGTECVDCKTDGNPLTLAFNAKYILEYCKNVTAEELNFVLNQALNPVLVNEKDIKDQVYILTPIRVIF